jgi:hypothetical protein
MTNPPDLAGVHEPTVETIQLVCDRLADLGLAVGPDAARDLVRAILMAEAPRLDARVRDAIGTSLETIRVAAQSAIGLLAATAPVAGATAPAAGVTPPAQRPERTAAPDRAAAAAPTSPPAHTAPPVDNPRPIARRGLAGGRQEAVPPAPASPPARGPDTPDEGVSRPVFKRPRGR